MSDVVKTINLKDGNVLEIYQDDYARSPRIDDEGIIGIMAAFHKCYDLKDKDIPFNSEMFEGWDEMKDYITGTLKSMVCLPLYMYDHSRITINTTGFSCSWDSGQIGFIYTTAKRLGDLGVNQENDESWEDYLARITSYLVSEVKTFDDYVTGKVYGFIIKNADDKEIDSCWGFYGDNHKTNGILDHIDEDNINLDDL